MKGIVAGMLLAGLVIGGLLVFGQTPFAPSMFEYQNYREYRGVLESWPYPMLITPDARYLLVGEGKHGADITGASGRSVVLQGALIRRGEQRMLEVLSGSLHASSDPSPTTGSVDLGPVTLAGEIVDTKCYLGVMNPGSGKVHRDCAVRCISGGAPPAFIASDASGATELLLLTGAGGRALHREVLDFVGEPIRIKGRLVRSGPSLILEADPQDFTRE